MGGRDCELDSLVHRGYRFALSLTHDVPQAEDLLQDAWSSILRTNAPWSCAYLFATIRNRFIDTRRRDKLIRTEPYDDHAHPMDAPRIRANWFEDGGVFSDDGALDDALSQLRPEERAVLYLMAVEEMSAREIARLLGRPRGTVLSMVHRAREKLRRAFQSGTESKP